MEQAQTRWNDEWAAWSSQAQEHVAQLEKSKVRGRALEAAVAQASVAGHYEQDAADQENLATRMRNGAVLAGTLGVLAVVGMALWSLVWGELSWQGGATKLAVALAFTGLTGYLATESRKAQERSTATREIHLLANALEPFVRDIDDPVLQREVRTMAAKRIFGVPGTGMPPATRSEAESNGDEGEKG